MNIFKKLILVTILTLSVSNIYADFPISFEGKNSIEFGKIERQSARTDRLYECFIDLLKEKK
jgi:hypothetical protein